jgi:hypothetical protein
MYESELEGRAFQYDHRKVNGTSSENLLREDIKVIEVIKKVVTECFHLPVENISSFDL